MRKAIIPKDFFSKERPTISIEEALKDIIPVDWKQILKESDDSDKPFNWNKSITSEICKPKSSDK